jgi:hypothetical protein
MFKCSCKVYCKASEDWKCVSVSSLSHIHTVTELTARHDMTYEIVQTIKGLKSALERVSLENHGGAIETNLVIRYLLHVTMPVLSFTFPPRPCLTIVTKHDCIHSRCFVHCSML